jgi:CheY-like chemotaxis protein
MSEVRILWADDEIDLLKPHIIFLEEKGYKVSTVTNGADAIDEAKNNHFDLVFLDENMPGLTGLETLTEIKELNQQLPIVLITKNEEEKLMEEAIGSKIADYLIKPVNPRQILLTIKKLIDNKRLVSEKTSSGYQQEFGKFAMSFDENLSHEEWVELYKKLVYWEIELEGIEDEGMHEILNMQKKEANTQFAKFVSKNYVDWINSDDKPVMSDNLMAKQVFPNVNENPTFLLVIDNLRYDQWKIINPIIKRYFNFKSEAPYYSILPTATQYARNAIFAGMSPADIEKKHPHLWNNEEDEGGKNMYEKELLELQVKAKMPNLSNSYVKITNHEHGKALADSIYDLMRFDLNVIVYNFVDMLSHARTEMEVIRELASDEAAYRSITKSWMEHSPLLDILKKLSEKKINLMVTTDHGTIRVKKPIKVVGDRNTSTNLRYKTGKSLNYNKNDVFAVTNPSDIKLPKQHMTSSFIFAQAEDYLVYPNNYNHFVNYYKDSFQHGGLSLEEVIIPFAIYESK